MATRIQEQFFLDFYNHFHQNLTDVNDSDNDKINNLLQYSIRTSLSKYKGVFSTMPNKNDLLKIYQNLVKSKVIQGDTIVETLLTTKAVRSSSGVLPISIALDGRRGSGEDDVEEGFSCAYNCSFCPNECVANGADKDIARSYLSSEGTFIRGAIQNFNTVEQVWRRLSELETMGHVPDKLEIIPLGGTWDCYPRNYREKFSQDLFYACNSYSLISMKYNGEYSHLLKQWITTKPFQNNLPLDPEMCKLIREKRPIQSLWEEKTINTKSHCCRIIGLVLETRPDRISRFTLLEKRKLGCTRIQLGIQHTCDEILRANNRGHDVKTTKKAISMSREAGFKVDGHIMPDLPFTCIEKDYEMVREVFLGKDLQLDYCKIYPCLDLPYTLARKWKETGVWKPYAESNYREFVKFLRYTLTIVPPWVRINRVQRDFPEASEKNNGLGYVSDTIKTNLHQLLDQEMTKNNEKCYDIRSREIKNTSLSTKLLDSAKLYIRTYRANEGTEFFISVEIPKNQKEFDDTYLLGLCRLRLSDWEFDKTADSTIPFGLLPVYRNKSCKIAKIRELHVYGNIASKTTNGNSQHKGVGKFLVAIAETISRIYGFDLVTIISGVGVRDYYEHLGYHLSEKEDEYMIKNLHTSKLLPNILFGKEYDTSAIRRNLMYSTISKKFINPKYQSYEIIDYFNNVISNRGITTKTYKEVQNGIAQGFSFSPIKENSFYKYLLSILFMFVMIFIYY